MLVEVQRVEQRERGVEVEREARRVNILSLDLLALEAVPLDDPGEPWRTQLTTDADGRYVLAGLPPGRSRTLLEKAPGLVASAAVVGIGMAIQSAAAMVLLVVGVTVFRENLTAGNVTGLFYGGGFDQPRRFNRQIQRDPAVLAGLEHLQETGQCAHRHTLTGASSSA